MARTDKWMKRWDVNSMSEPDKKYTVAQSFTHEWGCSCPHWRFRRKEFGGICKHILLILESTDAEKAQLLTREYNLEPLVRADWSVVVIEDNTGKLHIAATRNYGDRE